jgi:cell division protein FtsZ
VDPNANIIFGALVDESMEGEIAITVIATGFPLTTQQGSDSSSFENPPANPKIAYEAAVKDPSSSSSNKPPLSKRGGAPIKSVSIISIIHLI